LSDAVAAALAGNLCRCGSYQGIYAAIRAACAGDFDDVELGDIEYKRVDALPKVTGEAQYTSDKTFDNMLHGRVLRSIHPHAKVRSVDFSEALAMDGVVAAIEAFHQDDNTVNYVGDRIAAVAAVDVRTASPTTKSRKRPPMPMPKRACAKQRLRPPAQMHSRVAGSATRAPTLFHW